VDPALFAQRHTGCRYRQKLLMGRLWNARLPERRDWTVRLSCKPSRKKKFGVCW
jgi:hypothetical protein